MDHSCHVLIMSIIVYSLYMSIIYLYDFLPFRLASPTKTWAAPAWKPPSRANFVSGVPNRRPRIYVVASRSEHPQVHPLETAAPPRAARGVCGGVKPKGGSPWLHMASLRGVRKLETAEGPSLGP